MVGEIKCTLCGKKLVKEDAIAITGEKGERIALEYLAWSEAEFATIAYYVCESCKRLVV